MSTARINNIAELGTTVQNDNTVAGLVKMWANCAQGYGSFNDSFNTSGLTDLGVGNVRITFASSFTTRLYVISTACDASEIARFYATVDDLQSTNADVVVWREDTAAVVDRPTYAQVAGELA